jgi:hypothetical protein
MPPEDLKFVTCTASVDRRPTVYFNVQLCNRHQNVIVPFSGTGGAYSLC